MSSANSLTGNGGTNSPIDVTLLFLSPSSAFNKNKVVTNKQGKEVEDFQRLRDAEEKTSLGLIHMARQEQLNESENLFRDALKIRIAIHQDDAHPDILASMHNLAVLLSRCDDSKWKEANSLFEENLRRRQHNTSKDGLLDTVKTKHEYGNFLIRKQRKIHQGEQLLNESYDGYQELFGDDDPNTFPIKRDLVHFYRMVVPTRIHEAEKMQEDLFVHSEEIWGELHIDTLKEMSNLAMIYAMQSKNQQALTMYTECLEKRTKVLGIDDPATLQTMYDLALLQHMGMKVLDTAKSLYITCMNGQQRVLGDTHRDTLLTMTNLAAVYKQLGKYDEATSLYIFVVESYQEDKELGKHHPLTLTIMHRLAAVFKVQGKFSVAEAVQEDCFLRREKSLGETHSDTLDAMNSLAVIYALQGKLVPAESLYQECFTKRREVLGSDHPKTLSSMNNLAYVLDQQNKYDEASRVYEELIPKIKEILNAEDPLRETAVENYHLFLAKQVGLLLKMGRTPLELPTLPTVELPQLPECTQS